MKIDVFETMETLAGAFGPSGSERDAAEKIMELAEPFADELTVDVMGSVIARKTGGGKKVMFSAHMDTVGVVVTHIDERGYLRISNLGGISPAGVLGSLVVFSDGTRGVIGCDGKMDPQNLKIENFFIDIGARTREEAREKVRPGATAVYDQPCAILGYNIAAPYLNGRIACVALLSAMEKIINPINDLYFVFSAQGELGGRGAKTAAFSIEPDYSFTVAAAGTGDIPEAKPKTDVRLGGGTAIKLMDPSVMCHPKIVEFLRKKAEAENIPHQMEISLGGGSADAAAIQISRGGAYTGGISIPVRYIHGPLEVCCVSDVEACVELIVAASGIRLR